jgi:hypothetical protein
MFVAANPLRIFVKMGWMECIQRTISYKILETVVYLYQSKSTRVHAIETTVTLEPFTKIGNINICK